VNRLLAPLLLAAAAGAAAQEAPNLAVEMPPAGRVPVAQALSEGVSFLVKHQNADGSWGSYTTGRDYEVMASVPGSLMAFKAASSALCWMGLARAPRTPESEKAMERSLGWLVKHARVKRANPVEMYNIWALAYGLRALSLALRTQAPGAPEEEVRREAEAIVRMLPRYQVPDGGWTYYDFDVGSMPPSDSSMSFTSATVLIALHEAKEAGLPVPDEVVKKGVVSVRRCRKKDGSYLYGDYLKYVPRMGVNQPKGSSMRTPACDLALHLNGGGVTVEDLGKGIENIGENHRFAIAGLRRPIPHESWYQVSGYFYLYGHMYAGMALERVPPGEQRRLWPIVVRGILKAREPDGSFWDYPIYGFGKAYGTGYALMALARCPEEIAAGIRP